MNVAHAIEEIEEMVAALEQYKDDNPLLCDSSVNAVTKNKVGFVIMKKFDELFIYLKARNDTVKEMDDAINAHHETTIVMMAHSLVTNDLISYINVNPGELEVC